MGGGGEREGRTARARTVGDGVGPVPEPGLLPVVSDRMAFWYSLSKSHRKSTILSDQMKETRPKDRMGPPFGCSRLINSTNRFVATELLRAYQVQLQATPPSHRAQLYLYCARSRARIRFASTPDATWQNLGDPLRVNRDQRPRLFPPSYIAHAAQGSAHRRWLGTWLVSEQETSHKAGDLKFDSRGCGGESEKMIGSWGVCPCPRAARAKLRHTLFISLELGTRYEHPSVPTTRLTTPPFCLEVERASKAGQENSLEAPSFC